MSNHKAPVNMIDLAEKRFGKLTVVKRAGQTKNGNALWQCQCDCGNTTVAMGTSLRRGDTKSCGCLTPDRITNARQVLLTDKTIDGVPVPLLTKKVRSDSGTGIKGVHQRIKKGHIYYEASITVNGKRKYVGTFKDINQAIQARKEAEAKYFGPYIDALKNKENKK